MEGKDRLEAYLRENKVRFRVDHHPEALTAQEVAAAEHVPGRMVAKVVMVEAGGDLKMMVLPAPAQVDLDKAGEVIGADKAGLASEDEFAGAFPDCETGAMPPFGNLYGIPVFVDRSLTEQEEIVFEACTHTDVIRMRYEDFERLVSPGVAEFAVHP
jgi:Ala-tRNA(Pro) deacylase